MDQHGSPQGPELPLDSKGSSHGGDRCDCHTFPTVWQWSLLGMEFWNIASTTFSASLPAFLMLVWRTVSTATGMPKVECSLAISEGNTLVGRPEADTLTGLG